MMKLVRRTMPPTFGAEIASCMVLRCIREIFRPEISANAAATVMTPMPPIWMRSMITSCPKGDQVVAVSCSTRPVTQTAEVEVNSASRNGIAWPFRVETGSISSSAPSRITPRKPRIII